MLETLDLTKQLQPKLYARRVAKEQLRLRQLQFQIYDERIPVLCLFGATRNSWYFSEIWPAFQQAVPSAAERVQTKTIPEADPGFSLPAHTREFLDTVLGWMEAPAGAEPRRVSAGG